MTKAAAPMSTPPSTCLPRRLHASPTTAIAVAMRSNSPRSSASNGSAGARYAIAARRDHAHHSANAIREVGQRVEPHEAGHEVVQTVLPDRVHTQDRERRVLHPEIVSRRPNRYGDLLVAFGVGVHGAGSPEAGPRDGSQRREQVRHDQRHHGQHSPNPARGAVAVPSRPSWDGMFTRSVHPEDILSLPG